MQDYGLGLRLGVKDLPTPGAYPCITENGKKRIDFPSFLVYWD